MAESTAGFYADPAEWYHLIFEDWNHRVANQAAILGPQPEASERKSYKRDLRGFSSF